MSCNYKTFSICPVLIVLVAVVVGWTSSPTRAAQVASDFQPRTMPVLPSGIVLNANQQITGPRLVLLAKPRLAAGDVDAVPEVGHQLTRKFQLAIVAKVDSKTGNGQAPYQLSQVAIGFAVDSDRGTMTVNTKDGSKHGLKLGMLGSSVLSSNEASLSKTKLIASTDFMTVFDAQAVVWQQSGTQEMVVRHAVWIDPNTGKLGFLVWLLEKKRGAQLQVAQPQMHAVAVGAVEDRQIYVDKSKFMLGMPTPSSFAMLQITPGHPIAWSEQFRSLAAMERFTAESFGQFVQGLQENLRQAAVARRN